MITTSRRPAAAAAAAATALALAAGVSCQPGGGTAGSASPTPTDGMPYQPGGPALAVKIDNVAAARPSTGLGGADIVYVEPVEAGLSRLLAVYGSRLPDRVGPIRSARESDLELLRQFGRPAFAFSGARSSLLPTIADAPVHDVSPARAGDAYERRGPHSAPHNLYARPDALMAHAKGAQPPPDIGFRYGAAPRGGKATKKKNVGYKAFDVGFGWSAEKDRWLVSMDGRPYRGADGRRAAAGTVVVQYVDVEPRGRKDRHGNTSPYVTTTGSGKAVVMRDGKAYDARWERRNADGGTSYTTTDGDRIRFAQGQVWVVFAKR